VRVSDSPYRVPEPQPPRPPDPYLEAWRDLRRRRTVTWAAAAAWVVFGVATSLIRERTVFVWLLLMALVVAAQFRATLFPCPKCRESFGGTRFGFPRYPSGNECSHCGIVVGTPKDAGPEAIR
jgi:hypothetical protein